MDSQTIHSLSCVSLLSEDRKSNESMDSTSNFGDASCGEPLEPQHVHLDFTLTSDDTEFVQEKCCAFWEFVKTCPELEAMTVFPETEEDSKTSKRGSSSETISSSDTIPSASCQRTALSMLEFVEEKGLINRIFESRLPQSGCSLGSREYRDNNATLLKHTTSKTANVCKCRGACSKNCIRKQLAVSESPSIAVKKMCQAMEQWDCEHPKSMEPPAHPPELVEQKKQPTY